MKTTQQLKEVYQDETSTTNLGNNAQFQVDYLLKEIESLKDMLQSQADTIKDLKKQAMEDPLTGLANRRAFEKELKRSLSFFKRHGSEGALLLIDLDGFKSINDSLGHLAGDALLKHVAHLLQTHIRSSDFVARLGGDEFCIILNAVNLKRMQEKTEELAHIISSNPCRFEGKDIYASASIGGCAFRHALNFEDLIEKADASMYDRKNYGSAKPA